MRTIRIKLYKFSELSAAAQKKSIENLSQINVEGEWWNIIHGGAERIGLRITGFDIDNYCNAEFIVNAQDAANNILAKHRETCETYKTAQKLMIECKAKLESKEGFEEYQFADEIEELESEFMKSLSETYRIMLNNEYDYLTRKEAIIETIEANGYEFTKNGKIA